MAPTRRKSTTGRSVPGKTTAASSTPSSGIMSRSTRATTRSTSRPARTRREVVPDSDASLTGQVQSSSPSTSGRTAISTVKGVFIDSTKSKLVNGDVQFIDSTSSLSSVGHSLPSTRDNSVDYETADTSAVATPAYQSVVSKKQSTTSVTKQHAVATKRKISSRVGSSTEENLSEAVNTVLARSLQDEENGTMTHTTTRQKRKRRSPIPIAADRDEADVSNDAIYAQALQEEEYSAVSKPSKSTSKLGVKAIKQVIDDSDAALNEDEDESDFLSESEVVVTKRRRTTAASKARGTNPTNRRKNMTARKTSANHRPRNDAEDEILAIDDDDVSEPELEYFKGISDDDEDEGDDDSVDPSTIDFTTTRLNYRHMRRLNHGLNRKDRERKKLETSHPEIKSMWKDLEAIPKIVTAKDPQPAAINRALKSFQLEGVHWMREQEKTRWKGGLLGDEMGMGKTIQAVSLIMSDYPQKQPTLVVVPPVALMQWSSEINDYTDGKLKVLVYHGTNAKSKTMTVKQLSDYDVIMISYSSLESVHRKETKGWTRQDNIVKEDSAIHAIKYHRLILDEAHSIKSRSTGVAKACFALKGKYKWCLSGTPVQNRIGEFFSLLRFLEVTPFANYFCKSCPCSTLHWSVTKDYRCTHCKHRTLDHVSVFNQEILNPITGSDSESDRKTALGKLRLLTDRIMLRRIKRDYTSSMELPPKEIIIHNEFFGEIERDFSSSIMSNTARQFDTYVSRGVMLNNYANIFGLIMQMRQVSDHPDLLLKRHAETGQNVLVCNICDEPCEEAIRSRCKHEFCRSCVKDYIRTCEASGAVPDCPRCHISLAIDFDQPDIEQDEDSVKKSSIINRIKMENWTSSTKIEMLVYDLYKLRSKKQTLKSIVFSQFTSMLQLIEWRLRRAGFNTVMLDGSMSPAQRQKSIEYFMTNTDVEVFLVSLKAGGVALNLTEASRVFIVDPWWNPAAEWQSADRCHRIGQRRPCVITRLCIEDSVESRIVMLQEKKANMINGTVNNDDVAMEKLTPEDMQFLFRGS